MADLSVRIGSMRLKNPLIAASGCFGYGVEYAGAVDLASLGGVAVKGLFLKEREGHPPPRIVETPAGMLNAIGLANPGMEAFESHYLPRAASLPCTLICSVAGFTVEDYVQVAAGFVEWNDRGVAGVELNISCPNVKTGTEFGM